MPPGVFISYRRQDSSMLAQLIARELEKQGIDVFVDTRKVDGGGPFPDRLLRAIESADVFVCLVGPTTLESAWVNKEIDHAHACHKPMIPIFQENYSKPPAQERTQSVMALLRSDAIHIMDVKNIYIDEAIVNLAGMIRETVNPHPIRQFPRSRFFVAAAVVLILAVVGLVALPAVLSPAAPVDTPAAADMTEAVVETSDPPVDVEPAGAIINVDNAADVIQVNQVGRGVLYDVALSMTQSQLAVASGIGLWLYDPEDLDQEPLLLLDSPVFAVAISPDGSLMAVSDEDNDILLWDLASGSIVALMSGHPDRVTTMTFSPDGSLLASGGYDNTVRVWDVGSGSEMAVLTDHIYYVRDLAFSPDGASLVSASQDNTLILWDVATGENQQTFEGHTDYVLDVAWHPDGDWFASAGMDTKVRLWDAATGTLREDGEIAYTSPVQGVAISPDGRWLVAGDDDATIHVREITTGRQLPELSRQHAWLLDLQFVDETTLYSFDSVGTIEAWSVPEPESIHYQYLQTPPLDHITMSPDGMTVVFSGRDTVWQWSRADDMPELLIDERELWGTQSMDYAPDGDTILSTHGDGTLRQWMGGRSDVFAEIGASLSEARYTPSGEQIVAGGRDGNLYVWELASGDLTPLPEAHTGAVNAIAITSDGERIASAGEDGTVMLRALASPADVQTWTIAADNQSIYDLVFSPDNSILAIGLHHQIILWDVTAGEAIRTMARDGLYLTSLVFSPDGTLLASAGDDTSIHLWDVATGTELLQLDGHSESVNQVIFSPDGRLLLSVSDDGTLRLWGLPG